MLRKRRARRGNASFQVGRSHQTKQRGQAAYNRWVWHCSRLGCELLEERLPLTADPFYSAVDSDAGVDLTLQVEFRNGIETIELVRLGDGSIGEAVASEAVNDISGRIRIIGSEFDDSLHVQLDTSYIAANIPAGIVFEAGAGGGDTLQASSSDTTWNVTGPGAGNVGGVGIVDFTGVENLTGSSGNEDTFFFHSDGRLSGVLEGGEDGIDSLIAHDGLGRTVIFAPDTTRGGRLSFNNTTVDYSGLEPIFDETDSSQVVLIGSILDDDFVLEDPKPDDNGMMHVRIVDPLRRFLQSDGTLTDSFSFDNPLTSVTVQLRTGNDQITIGRIDPDFGGSVIIHGDDDEDTLAGPDTANVWNVTAANSGTFNNFVLFNGVENLAGGADTDTFTLGTGGILNGNLKGGDGDDELVGSDRDIIWNVTGPNAGELTWNVTDRNARELTGQTTSVMFQEVEHLTGAADNDDAFLFDTEGSLTGMVEGGADGFDSLIARDGVDGTVIIGPTDIGVGSAPVHGTRVSYSGLDPLVSATGAGEIVVNATSLDDEMILEQGGPGKMRLGTTNGAHFLHEGMLTDEITIDNPSTSLTVQMKAGDDKLELGDFDPDFNASLYVFGAIGQDAVLIKKDLTLPGNDLDISAEIIATGTDLYDQSTPPKKWTPNETHEGVATNTNGDGTGMTLNVVVDENGKPTARISNLGSGYVFGDRVWLSEPGKVDRGPTRINAFVSPLPAVTISTRNVLGDGNSIGDSGSIRFSGRVIIIGEEIDEELMSSKGTKLLAHVDENSTDTAGDITLSAKHDSNFFLPNVHVNDSDTSISLINATVKGKDITISAASASGASFNDDSEGGEIDFDWLDSTIAFAETFNAFGGLAISNADADVVVEKDTTIEAATLAIDATALSDATVKTTGTAIAFSFGQSNPTATVTLDSGVNVTTTGDLKIHSLAESTMSVGAKLSLIGPTRSRSKGDFTAAFSRSNIQSLAKLAEDATVDVGGRLEIIARMEKEHDNSAAAGAYEDGTVGDSFSISQSTSNVAAIVGGNVAVHGDIVILAESNTPKNDTAASATVGTGFVANFLIGHEDDIAQYLSQLLTLTGTPLIVDGRTGTSNESFAQSGSWAYARHTNDVSANIAQSAQVTSEDGSITILSSVVAVPEMSAISFVDSTVPDPNDEDKVAHEKENSFSTAVAIGRFTNKADAFIGNNAIVNAKQDISVEADASLPYEIQWFQLNDFSDLTDKANSNFGIQNGFFTSFSQSSAEGSEHGVAGSINNLIIDNDSNAYVAEDAKVNSYIGEDDRVSPLTVFDPNAFGRVHVIAQTNARTVNLSGNFGVKFFGSKDSKSVGGAYLGFQYNNSATARIRNGAVVFADTLFVKADTNSGIVGIAESGGIADEFALNASFSVLGVNNYTFSQIDPGAIVQTSDDVVRIAKEFERRLGGRGRVIDRPVQFIYVDNDNALVFPHAVPMFRTGDAVAYNRSADNDIEGLRVGEIYYVIRTPPQPGPLDRVQLAETEANARAAVAIELGSSDGIEGEHFLTPIDAVLVDPTDPTGSIIDSELDIITDPGFSEYSTTDEVIYNNHPTVGLVSFPIPGIIGGEDIDGLVNGETYYVIKVGPETIQLARTMIQAQLKIAVDLDASSYIPTTPPYPHEFKRSNRDAGNLLLNNDALFKPNLIKQSVIELRNALSFLRTGDAVTYSNRGGDGDENTPDDIGGLVDGETYFVIATTPEHVQLASSEEDALAGRFIALDPDTAKGRLHSLSPDRDALVEDVLVSLDSNGDGLLTERDSNITAVDPGAFLDDPFDDIYVTNLSQLVIAEDESRIFDVSGAVFKGESTGIGPSTSINDIRRNTQAVIGAPVFEPGVGDPVFGSATTVGGALNRIDLGYRHDFETGDAVIYNTDGGEPIGGLLDGTIYYVIVSEPDFHLVNRSAEKIKLAATREEAKKTIPIAIHIDLSEATGSTHSFTKLFPFDPSTDIDATDAIDLGSGHGFVTGEAVIYQNPSEGEDVDGLVVGETYFVIIDDDTPNGVTLASSRADAFDATAIDIDPSVATGSGHHFTTRLGSVTSEGRSKLAALGNGVLDSYSLAGAALAGTTSTSTQETDNTPNEPDGNQFNDVKEGSTQTDSGDTQNNAHDTKTKTGIGIAGSVSFNNVRDETLAYVNRTGPITAHDVVLTSQNDTHIRTVSGAVAVAVGEDESKTSNVIAGAFSRNKLNTWTRSFIVDATINATTTQGEGLSLAAERKGELFAFSGGGALTSTKDGAGVTGSVSLNRILNTTETFVDRIDLVTSGDIRLEAKSESEMNVGAGSGASGNRNGVGGSVARNRITNTTRAVVFGHEDQTSIIGTQDNRVGKLELSATNENTIRTVAVSAGVGKDNGIAVTLANNLIDDDTAEAAIRCYDGTPEAAILCAEVFAARTVALTGTDDSSIQSASGVLGVGQDSLGIGAALGWNRVKGGNVIARIENAGVDTLGAVNLAAQVGTSGHSLNGKIAAVSAGAGGSTRNAGGGSLSFNVIQQSVDAHIANSSDTCDMANSDMCDMVVARGSVVLSATDRGTIGALSGAAALGTGGQAIGAALGYNDINNETKAYIENYGAVKSTSNSIDVDAKSETAISSITLGGTGAETFAVGGSVGVNLIRNDVDAYISETDVAGNHGVGVSAIDRSPNENYLDLGFNHGFRTGDEVIYESGSGASIGGLVDGETYYVMAAPFEPRRIKLAATHEDAVNGREISIDNSLATGSSHTLTRMVSFDPFTAIEDPVVPEDPIYPVNAIDLGPDHRLASGDEVVYKSGDGEEIGGLTDGNSYSVIVDSDDERIVMLAESFNPHAPITLDTSMATGHSHTLLADPVSFNPSRRIEPSRILGIAGGGALATQGSAFGAALATNDVINTTKAYINNGNNGTVSSANGGVELASFSEANTYSLTLSGSGADDFALGGSISVNIVNNTIDAHIRNSDGETDSSTGIASYGITAAGDILVSATDNTVLDAGTGGIALAGSAGSAAIGAALGTSVIANTTQAYIDNSSVFSSAGSVEVNAESTAQMFSASVSGSVAGSLNINGSIAVNNSTNTVSAYIGPASTVRADGNVVVSAVDEMSMTMGAGNIGGAKTVALGVSNSTIITSNKTEAYIADGAVVNALGNQGAVAVFTGTRRDQAATIGGLEAGNTYYVIADSTEPNRIKLAASAENAESGDEIALDPSVATGGAHRLSRPQGLSSSQTTFDPVNDVEENAIDIGEDHRLETGDTVVYTVPEGEKLTKNVRGLSVTAVSFERIRSLAASAQGAGKGGVAGAATITVLGETTNAFIGNGAQINVSDENVSNEDAHTNQIVNVLASDSTTLSGNAGGIAGAKYVGIGAGVDVGIVNKQTLAFVGMSATVHAEQDVEVRSLADGDVTSRAGAAGFGVLGVAGGVSILTLGGLPNAGRLLNVLEGTQADRFSPSRDVGDPDNDDDKNTIDLGERHGLTTGDAVTYRTDGGDAIGGLTRADTYYVILDSDDDARVLLAASASDALQGIEIDLDSSQATGSVHRLVSIVENGATTTSTEAFIGDEATVTAGGNILVRALDNLKINTITGQASVGGVAAGAAVTVINVGQDTEAYIGELANIDAVGNVSVRARFHEHVEGRSIAGSAGLVAVEAQVSVIKDTSTQSAYISNSAMVTQADVVRIEALADRQVSATARGGAFGGTVAGASIGKAEVGGSTRAYLGNDVQVGQMTDHFVENVEILADSDVSVTTSTRAVAAGLGVAAEGSNAQTTVDPVIDAYVGTGAGINVSESISILSLSEGDADAMALGFAIAPGIASGHSNANATLTPNLKSYIGDNATVTVGQDIELRSMHNYGLGETGPFIVVGGNDYLPTDESDDGVLDGSAEKGAHAKATASGGSLISDGAGFANATSNAIVEASIAGGATINAGRDVTLESRSNNDADSSADGNNGGIFAIGSMEANSIASLGTIPFDPFEDVNYTRRDSINFGFPHRFFDGQQVSYAFDGDGDAIGGLANGESYYVIVVDPNTIRLANSAENATAEEPDFLDLSPTTSDVLHRIVSLGSTRAYMENVRSLNSDGDLTISANETNRADARAEAANGGVVAVRGTVANSDAGPKVEASVSGGNSIDEETGLPYGINIGGTADIQAIASGSTSAKTRGAGGGLVDIGSSISTPRWRPTVEARIGDETPLTAHDDVHVTAFSNHDDQGVIQAGKLSHAEAVATSGGLVSVPGATVDVVTKSIALAHIGSGASVSAGSNLNLTAKSGNNSTAVGTGRGFGGVAVGSVTTNATMENEALAITAAGTEMKPTKLIAGHVITIHSESNNQADIGATGGAGGLVGVGNAEAQSELRTNNTHSVVGDWNTINAAQLVVQSSNNGNIRTDALQDTSGGLVSSLGVNATTSITESMTVSAIGDNSVVDVKQLTLNARDENVTAEAMSSATSYQVGGRSEANSNVEANLTSLAEIGPNADITASEKIVVISRQDNIVTNTTADTAIGAGLTGSLFSAVDNLLVANSHVATGSGSILRTKELLVEADTPFVENGYITSPNTDARTVFDYVWDVVGNVCNTVWEWTFGRWVERNICDPVMGWVRIITNSVENATIAGNEDRVSSIDFNSRVDIIGDANAEMEIGEAANVFVANGITIDDDDDTTLGPVEADSIVVQDVNNAGAGEIRFVSPKGRITGNATFNLRDRFDVSIINHSSKNLVINDVDVESDSDFRIDVADTSRFQRNEIPGYTLASGLADAIVEIINKSEADVILQGVINNPEGTTTIRNEYGEILETSNIITARSLSLIASQGSIGRSDRPIEIQLVQSEGLSTDFTLQAGIDLYANLKGVLDDDNPFVSQAKEVTAGGIAQITFTDGVRESVQSPTVAATVSLTSIATDEIIDIESGEATGASHTLRGANFDPEAGIRGFNPAAALETSSQNFEPFSAVHAGEMTFDPFVALQRGPQVFNPSSDVTGNAFKFGSNHGLRQGEQIVYQNGGGTSIEGLVDGQTYFVVVIDSRSIQLAETREKALAELPEVLHVDSSLAAGSEHRITSKEKIRFRSIHGFDHGQAVLYQNGGGTSVGGLSNGQTYYIVKVDSTTISLAESRDEALGENPTTLLLDRSEAEGTEHSFRSAANTRISFVGDHGFVTGEAVVYSNGDGTSIGGLIDGQTYYVLAVDSDVIKLAAEQSEATQQVPTIISLDPSVATAASHSLTSIERIQFDVPHDFTTGQSVVYHHGGGGTAIGGLSDGETYYVAVVDATSIKLAMSKEDSLSEMRTAIRLDRSTAMGSDHGLSSKHRLELGFVHGFATGQAVLYSDGDETGIGGLTTGETYYVVKVNAMSIKLAETETDALTGVPIALDLSAATGTNHNLSPLFTPASVNGSADTIDLGFPHGLETGQAVTYSSGRGTSIGGLSDGQTYFVVVVDSETVRLAASEESTVRSTNETEVRFDKDDLGMSSPVVIVNGPVINITLNTHFGYESTAQDLVDAINGNAEAASLIRGELTGNNDFKIANDIRSTPATELGQILSGDRKPIIFEFRDSLSDTTPQSGTYKIAAGGDDRGDLTVSGTSNDIELRGPLRYESVFLSGLGSILSSGTEQVVAAQHISLKAGGNVGTAEEGVKTDARGGRINVIAGDSIYLTEVDGNLPVGKIRSMVGDVTLTAKYGSMLDEMDDDESDVVGANISLTAQNAIGSNSNHLETESDSLNAAADGNIGVTEVTHNLNVERVSSNSGDVMLRSLNGDVQIKIISSTAGSTTVTASGSIRDASNTAGSNIAAKTISLIARKGQIGTPQDDLDIDLSDSATGSFDASAQGDIHITEVDGALMVDQVTSVTGHVSLTVLDSARTGEDLVFVPDGTVRALVGSATLQAGDDIRLFPTNVVEAAKFVAIRGDHDSVDNIGSNLDLQGTLSGNPVEIGGQDDDDVFTLTNVTTGTPFLVVDGGLGNDELNVDDSGYPDANSGILNQKTVTGLGTHGAVEYADIENLVISLGAGDDHIDVQGTTAVTKLNSGDGSDAIVVTNSAGSVDDIVGALHVDTQGGANNFLRIDDSGDPDGDANIVIAHDSVTGLAPARILYESRGGNFESRLDTTNGTFDGAINILAGAGGNRITVVSTRNDPRVVEVTSILAGTDDDMIAIADNEARYLVVDGQTGDDVMTVGALMSGDDVALSLAGPISMQGGSGDDTYEIVARNNHLQIDDEDGENALDFRRATTGVHVDLALNNGQKQKFGGGDSFLALTGAFSRVTGSEYDDRLSGNDRHNTITGLTGNDLILGRSGDDLLDGGAGNDTVEGGTGNDVMIGGGGNDRVDGGRGDDRLDGGGGDDHLRGNDGNDLIRGGDGNDRLVGGFGLDILLGGQGDDWLLGLENRDLLIGGTGADWISLGPGDDILIAGKTVFDDDDTALWAIANEWSAPRSYQERVKNLTDGSGSPSRRNGDFFLQASTTITDDAARDLLLGGLGLDWFFFDLDIDRSDLKKDEVFSNGIDELA